MKNTILTKLRVECPFSDTLEDTELVEGHPFLAPKRKIGHIRADHDGWRWHNTCWPCHDDLAAAEACAEIDRVYQQLTASDALKDLAALRDFCFGHMEACVSAEDRDEFNFYYVGTHCDFWIRLITREKDHNMYLNAYAKNQSHEKYFDYLERLRESGETNMYGAAGNLQDAFSELRCDRRKAEKILLAWIASYDSKEGDGE